MTEERRPIGPANDVAPARNTDHPAGHIDQPTSEHQSSRRSISQIASREYHSGDRGPELVTSWPIGAPPDHTQEQWQVRDHQLLQRAIVQLPYALPVDNSPSYLNVCGRGYVDEGRLDLTLSNDALSGKPYEVTIELTNSEPESFVLPMVEFTPETDEYHDEGRIYAGFRFTGRTHGGTGYLDRGTSVQLWSG